MESRWATARSEQAAGSDEEPEAPQKIAACFVEAGFDRRKTNRLSGGATEETMSKLDAWQRYAKKMIYLSAEFEKEFKRHEEAIQKLMIRERVERDVLDRKWAKTRRKP
jgi:hypothetical protein